MGVLGAAVLLGEGIAIGAWIEPIVWNRLSVTALTPEESADVVAAARATL